MLLLALILAFSSFTSVLSESSCQHETQTKLSKCEGCPPMYNGLPCASTTWYNDMTKGACGCGSEPNPPDFWTKSKFTAAGNAMMMDPDDPLNSWCPSNCGRCFRLCKCGDGYGESSPYLCGQNLSPWQCLSDPSNCAAPGNTNIFGYPAHFDLQNANLQTCQLSYRVTLKVTEGLDWHNSEVTFEEVSCSMGDFGDWESDCYCPGQGN